MNFLPCSRVFRGSDVSIFHEYGRWRKGGLVKRSMSNAGATSLTLVHPSSVSKCLLVFAGQSRQTDLGFRQRGCSRLRSQASANQP